MRGLTDYEREFLTDCSRTICRCGTPEEPSYYGPHEASVATSLMVRGLLTAPILCPRGFYATHQRTTPRGRLALLADAAARVIGQVTP